MQVGFCSLNFIGFTAVQGWGLERDNVRTFLLSLQQLPIARVNTDAKIHILCLSEWPGMQSGPYLQLL